MNEPAIKPDPDERPEDDYSEGEDNSPDLESIKGGGESTPRREGHLSSVPEDSADPGTSPSGLRSIDGGGESTPRREGHLRDASGASSRQLDSAERQGSKGYGKYSKKTGGYGAKSAVPGAEQGLVKGGLPSLINKPSQGLIGLASRMFQSKRARNGGLIGGGIVGIAIIMITTFSPVLRLDHLMQNINNKAFAAAGNAVENRMEFLFERYLIRKVVGLRGCKAVVSTNCRFNYTDAGLATNLWRAWSDARIEEKLFNRMGLQVESTRNPDRRAGVHSFTLRDRTGNKITWANEGDYNRFKDGQFKGGRREFGRELRRAIKAETAWYQVMERVQVRKMLARKHDIKFWCFLARACKKLDAAEEKIKDTRTNWKYRFIERFVYPFSAKYGVIMTCITTGDVANGNCKDKLQQQGIDQRDIPADEVDEILEDLEDAESRSRLRFGSVVMERILAKIIGKTAASTTISTLPFAGQAYLGLTVLYLVDSIDQAIENNELSKLSADIKSSQYIHFYAGIRSDSDAIKKGELPLEDLGAHVDAFNGAEKSKVWQAYNNKQATNNRLAFLLPSATVSAQGEDEDYKCANGKPIPPGQLVCEEKKINQRFKVEEIRSNSFVDGIIGAVNTMDNCIDSSLFSGLPVPIPIPTPSSLGPIDLPCETQVRDAVGALLKTVDLAVETALGPVIDGAVFALQNTPGSKQLMELIAEKVEELASAVYSEIFPLPVPATGPSRDNVDGVIAGGDLTANGFTKGGYTDDGDSFGQGAPKIAPDQLGAIYQDQMEQEEWEFKNSGFINRIANTSEPKSLVSKIAFSIPTDLSGAFLSVLSAPATLFKNLSSLPNVVFGSTVSAQSLAQQQASVNAFGVSRYGYPPGHPALTANPGKYTPEYCAESAATRLDSMSENNVTGLDEYSKADPCLLEEVAVETGCALYVSGDSCGGGETAEGVSGDAQSLAKEIVDSGKITGDSRYMGQLEAISNGNFSCNVNPYILEMLVGLLREGHSLYISSLNRQCTGVLTASGTGSYHYREGGGHAIDITSFDGKETTGSTNTVPYWEAAIPFLPEGTGIGQVASCGSGFSLPSGFSPVPDTCDHAHIQVPVKQANE